MRMLGHQRTQSAVCKGGATRSQMKCNREERMEPPSGRPSKGQGSAQPGEASIANGFARFQNPILTVGVVTQRPRRGPTLVLKHGSAIRCELNDISFPHVVLCQVWACFMRGQRRKHHGAPGRYGSGHRRRVDFLLAGQNRVADARPPRPSLTSSRRSSTRSTTRSWRRTWRSSRRRCAT